MKNYVITVGRQHYSGGRSVGKMIAEKLGIKYFDGNALREKARELGIEDGLFEMFDEQPTRSLLFSVIMDPYAIDNALNSGKVVEAQRRVIEKVAEEGPCVIVGRRAEKILECREDLDIVSIFIAADIDDRIAEYIRSESSVEKNPKRSIEHKDRDRAEYYNYLGDGKWGSADNYTMCFSTSKMSKEKICDIVVGYVNTLK